MCHMSVERVGLAELVVWVRGVGRLKNLHRNNNMGYGGKHSKKCTGINMDSSVNRHTNAKNKRRSQHVWHIGGNSLCLTSIVHVRTVTGVPTHLLSWAFTPMGVLTSCMGC